MLDYKLIEALAMVIQESGFERAAQTLNITQSAVSQRIKLLEEQVGQVLLARTTPPQATMPGKKLLKHYLQVKHLEQDLGDTIAPDPGRDFTTISIGINADSLATWFLEAIYPVLRKRRLLLDIRTDDQDLTHRMLKDGEVVGCISTQARPLQGCGSDLLGRMHYGLVAAPTFIHKWFPAGLTPAAAKQAPAVIFNRKDTLHHKLFQRVFGKVPTDLPAHYIPSSERFADAIAMGLGYGMLPRQQSDPLVGAGRLVELLPEHKVPVDLYWQCWKLKSLPLEQFTDQLIGEAKRLLSD
jgi:LysR family transcriptional regulator (chromosome initiation inhibitor)